MRYLGSLRAITATALVLASGYAFSEPIPKTDIDGHCRKAFDRQALQISSAKEHYTRCFNLAQSNYDKLKAIWSIISEEDQKKCISDNAYATSSLYSSLLSCVDLIRAQRKREQREIEEAEERRQVPKREFRY